MNIKPLNKQCASQQFTRLFATLLLLSCLSIAGCNQAPTEYQWQIPEGFPIPKTPDDNPMSEAKVRLGEALFFDTNLSANQSQSCSTCHQPELAFSESLVRSVGSTGEVLSRNSMALVNVAYNTHYTWAHNGMTQIEQQIMIPLFSESPVEMGVTGNEEAILARFDTPLYRALFEDAFGEDEASFLSINYALASFVRQLLSFDSPFDHYAYQNKDEALTESQKRGLNLFFSERTECHHCHGGFNLSQSAVHEGQTLINAQFHNTGLYNVGGTGAYPTNDNGLFEVTQNIVDSGAFRAPSLRNVGLTAPYMHDGSVATLADVIALYNEGGRHVVEGEFAGDGRENRFKSPFIKPLNLTAEEQQDLVNFLHSLSDESFIQRYQHRSVASVPPHKKAR